MRGQRLRHVAQGFFIDRQTHKFSAGRDAKPQIGLPVFVEHGHERNQALLEFGQAGFEFNGFGFDLRPCVGHGPAAGVLQREVMRDVLGLVGREQGRSGRGRGSESKTDLHRNGFSNLNWLQTLFRMYFLQALCRRKRRVPTGFLWLGVAIFAVTLRVFAGAQAGHNETIVGAETINPWR